MNRNIIHPLKQLIIRENNLVGFEGQINLDKLNDDLSFYKTKEKSDSMNMDEFLDHVRGGWGIPKSGWVEIKSDPKESIEEIWKKAMIKLREEELIR